ncbi:MAG: hypothetical protein ACSHXY_10715 [Alphaproteobacteria bacterium]
MIWNIGFKCCILSILIFVFGSQSLFASEYPETEPNDTRKVRSSTSPEWLQAVGRSIAVKSKTEKEGCSWSLIVDVPGKNGVIVVGAGHCVDHWYLGGEKYGIEEHQITWTTQSGKKITRHIATIFQSRMSTGDYAIAKLDRPISRFDIKPLMSAPYDYGDLLDEELFYANGEPFKPFGTMAGYSADISLGQKGKVLTYDEGGEGNRCQLHGGEPGNKKGYCWSYTGASGGAVAVTLYLSGDLDGDKGGLFLFEDYIPNVKPGPYTFWVGSIVGGEGNDGNDKTMFTESSHYSQTLDKILAAH